MRRVAVLGAIALGGCSPTPLGYLEGSASHSQDILQRLGIGLSLVSVAVILIIIALISIAMARSSRAARTDGDIVERSGSGLLLIYWGVALSLPVLVALAAWTFEATNAIANPPAGAHLKATVTGHRWWWEVRYDGPGGAGTVTSANQLVIPTGVPVVLDLNSADVIHDFWVPKLGPKMDMIPGRTNTSWIEARTPGNYRVQCAEYCGIEHAHMAMVVRAMAPADYRAWLAKERSDALAPAAPLFTERCGACHTVRGSDAAGIAGPELTHFASRPTIAAGALPNSPANLDRWIDDPQGVKPGAMMPKVALTPIERVQLVQWLERLQ